VQRLLINDLGRHNAPLMAEIQARVRAVLDSGWYILGAQGAEFEAAFAAYCRTAHCVGVANGTDAIELALRALGVGLGGQVATVANAGGYSTVAIRAAGAEPLFVDVDRSSMLMDPAGLRAALTSRTKAIVVTHLYGRMADMPQLMAIADAAGIPVVEDCAQAHGARLAGTAAGAWGTLGCFSFYPTKNLGALGDAGAVVTNDAPLAERVRELRQYGWRRKYECGVPGGRNSRLDEMQAAVLCAKLPHLDRWNMRRREIAGLYSELLRGSAVQLPPAGRDDDVAHLYVVRTRHRDRVRTHLAELGIAAEVHYPTVDHRQECYRGEAWARVELPEAEACCAEVLTLPCFPEMRDDEVERVAEAVRVALRDSAG
jgi:dTDP-3-amino-2,3,6-trideoxy-4-keto-D-glucose/dTDP-3-amino-3,4,6-trideoxy-alpha-D-glucose/dTDP-2,6-dideoxy-D-kanosamine transaminase